MKKLMIVLMVAFWATIGLAAPIHDAATAGDLEQVKTLLAENPSLISAKDNAGQSPLHRAAYAGKVDVARYLIEQGADINALTNSGSSPLHGAAFYGFPEAAKLLIEKGANVNIANVSGYTPLLGSAAGGHFEIAKMLIEAGADKSALLNDSHAGLLLTAGVGGNTELVNHLLDIGFDPKVTDGTGEGLLHYAAAGGNLDMVKSLVERGIEVNTKSETNVTPLHYAAQRHNLDVIKYLVEAGADVDVKDDEGETCVLEAAIWSRGDTTGETIRTIEYLVQNGADINSQSNNGQAAIHWAVYREQPDLLNGLLSLHANPNIQTSQGLTPLQASIRYGNYEVSKALLSGGARTDFRDSTSGFNSLHEAVLKGNLDLVKAIIDKIPDINSKDNSEHTALYYASKYGHKKVADLLKANGAKEKNLEKNFGYASELNKKPAEQEAVLWYLGHCGWAVETKNHLLVFDYWERGGKPDQPRLANGHIAPEELNGQNVEVFVSHEHQDHFDPVVFSWADSIDNLTYIFGVKPEELPEEVRRGYNGQAYEYIDSHSTKTIDGMTITTISANDAGQGFLVEVDGMNIYFAGDHAGWRENEKQGYTGEIDFLAARNLNIDLAFVNVTGCHVHDTLSLAEGTYYTIEKLAPNVLVPTHGIDREYVYKQYADKIHKQGYDIEVLCAEHRGDKYIYKHDQIM